MTISTIDAAKYLCEKSGWKLTNLKLQKLLYIAHMFHLGKFKEPLIDSDFEAWDYGPVSPKLYHLAKIYGSQPVKNIFPSTSSDLPENGKKVLDAVLDKLSNKPAGSLVKITHSENGAWSSKYTPGLRGIRIDDNDILKEYEARTNG